MIDTNHWRFQRILREAAAYRVLRDAIADRAEEIQTEQPRHDWSWFDAVTEPAHA
jgi:hypothetical protein